MEEDLKFETTSVTSFDRNNGDMITKHQDGKIEIDKSGRTAHRRIKKFWNKFRKKHPETWAMIVKYTLYKDGI